MKGARDIQAGSMAAASPMTRLPPRAFTISNKSAVAQTYNVTVETQTQRRCFSNCIVRDFPGAMDDRLKASNLAHQLFHFNKVKNT